MADPLSIAASVAGLLGVAGKISSIISGFFSSVADAPESALQAFASVEGMRVSLVSIKLLMDRLPQLPRDRKEMIHVRHLVVTFRESIRSLSELEAILGPAAGTDGTFSPWDRTRWALEEEKIMRSVQRVESHKNSLSMMLGILQCESDIQARECLDILQETVGKLLDQNQALVHRLEQFDFFCGTDDRSVRFFDDSCSTIRGPELVSISAIGPPVLPTLEDTVPLHAASDSAMSPREFEVALEKTRVYTRVQSHESDVSFTSSVPRSNAWSMLSGLSLYDISPSVISVIALPITLEEINSIGDHLTFSKIISGGPAPQFPQPSLDPPPTRRDRTGRLSQVPVPPSVWKFPRLPRRPPPEYQKGSVARSAVGTRSAADSRAKASVRGSSSASKLELYKLLVLGDGGVGKTGLTIQFCLNHFVETYDATIEDSYRKQIKIDGQACMVEVLDTAGQEEYMALRDQWIRDAEGYMIVYSITSRSSFVRVEKFFRQIHRVKESTKPNLHPLRGPLPVINEHESPVAVMLVGNNCERVLEREVSIHEGRALARELGCDFVEASARSCINVEEAFFGLVRELRRARTE